MAALPFELAGLILAGGKSSRMGQDKALLPFQNQPLISHAVQAIQPYCQEILLSTRSRDSYPFLPQKKLLDPFPDIGPISGLVSGVREARFSWVFVWACDMPYFEPKLLELLWSEAQSGAWDCICPQSRSGIEPLFMLVHKNCLPAVEASIQRKDYKLSSFFPEIRVKIITWNEVQSVDSQGRSFLNWNRPEDLNSGSPK